MSFDSIFFDIDPDCSMFGKRQVIQRRHIFNHNKLKTRMHIIDILKKHDVILDFSILSDITLVNVLTDCCVVHNARKLLGERINDFRN